jgi:hypothetical protein
MIITGILLVVAGGIIYLISRTGIPLGRLPGDIRIVRENFTCVFPLTSMILISILLTLILNIVIRLLGRK